MKHIFTISLCFLALSLSAYGQSQNTLCGCASENNTLDLQAPDGYTFGDVIFASYGLPQGECGNFEIGGGCHALNSEGVIHGLIEQNAYTLSVGSNNSVFGDPCIGVNKILCVELSLVIVGCTDPLACNFNQDADTDDGSCIPMGCSDISACNFNPEAECDGGACDYTCCPGPGCCTDGMYWDWDLEGCFNINPTDTNLDGCTDLNDLMDILANYGDCAVAEFTCGDPLQYQGYDYETVQIGEQCWFADNLRSELYANGNGILSDVIGDDWEDLATGASAIYGESDGCEEADYFSACNPDESLDAFGRLYNWFAVDDVRGICPVGWHVPTDDEWFILENTLGGGNMADEALKTTYGWNSDNGTNSSGFSALPSGKRDVPGGDFSAAGNIGGWWSSTENGTSDIAPLGYAWTRLLNTTASALVRYDPNKKDGFSIRCIKD